jgi:Tfp pilus assembly protein PilP
MCRKHVLMSLLALGWVPANLCWSQTDPVSPPPPQVELQAHGVDGVELLRAIAEVTPFNLLAVREGHPARIDIPAHAASMEGVWADIIARSGLQRVARNGYEVVGNACRLPLSAEPGPVLPDKNRLTLHFNKIPTDLFFALMAQVRDLELDAPEGLPAADLAMLIRSRPADEILETVDNLLALDTHIDGRRLVVKRKPGPRACMTTGSETWQASLPQPAALTQSLNELEKTYSKQMDQPCRRLADFPDTAKQSCDYLEYFPLEKLSMRGYIRLTPESPISVLVESPEPSLHRVWSGDPVGDQAGVIGWVDTDKVDVLERLGSAQPYADEADKQTEIRFATGERRIQWVLRA